MINAFTKEMYTQTSNWASGGGLVFDYVNIMESMRDILFIPISSFKSGQRIKSIYRDNEAGIIIVLGLLARLEEQSSNIHGLFNPNRVFCENAKLEMKMACREMTSKLTKITLVYDRLSRFLVWP